MRIGICDDMTEELNNIKNLTEIYANNHNQHIFNIATFSNSFEFLENYEKCGGYDILLLDICMPGILEVDVAREIRSKKDKCEIIFLTSCADYAVDAFALKATHYLVKPFKSQDFYDALDRAMEKIQQNQVKNLVVKIENGNACSVNIDEIYYCEAIGHNQQIHMMDSKIVETRSSLSELFYNLEQLSQSGQFIMPYKGFIVNQKQIKEITPSNIILKTNCAIPLVKRNFNIIKKQYFDFIFRKE